MFRRIIWAIGFLAVFGAAGVVASNTAEAWWSYGSYGYYNVPLTPYGYATAYGSAYPGAPYYQGYGPPYYPGYGPPYYPGYGPPYYPGYGPPYVGGYRASGYRYAGPYVGFDDMY